MFRRFSFRDVARAFPARDFERGCRYFEQGRVRHFEVVEQPDGTLGVTGEVRGSGDRIYTQELDIERREDGIDVFSACTCPVGYDCKHVVAVCLMVRRFLAHGAEGERAEASDARLRRWLARVRQAGRPPGDDARREALVYVLTPRPEDESAAVDVELRVVRRRKDGTLGRGRRLRLDRATDQAEPPACLDAEDTEIARLLGALRPRVWEVRPELTGALGYLALERMLATGRCHFGDPESPPLEWGEPRRLDVHWREAGDGRLRLQLAAGSDSLLLPTDPPLYLDPECAKAGRLETPLRPAQIAELLAAPALLAGDAGALAQLLANEFPELPLPPPADAAGLEAQRHPLTPCLTLAGSVRAGRTVHELRLEFEYGGHRVPARPQGVQSVVAGPAGLVRLHRDAEAEDRALTRLTGLGFEPLAPPLSVDALRLVAAADSLMESAGRWSVLLHDVVPELEREGWRIEQEDSFALRFTAGDWHAEVAPDPAAPNDWFSLRFDLEVDGRRLPLLPLLMPLIEHGFDRPLPPRVSVPLPGSEPGDAHRYVDLPVERLRPFLETLRDLFDAERLGESEAVPLSRFDAAVLERLEDQGTPVAAPSALTALARRLAEFEGIQPVAPPCGLRAELRPYQQRGLDWLQFLRAYDLGGILADDMGLGKTLQALAHLLVEKQSGRLDRPALVVAPTSLVSNWAREAARFAPDLSVLVLHGAERRARFQAIPAHDLVITTYPLLPRDRAALAEHAFHVLILDEAQTVKNPRSKAAAAVRALDARHRLCLTGTPMENHLGELWAQFDFLMPGFLGTEEAFRQTWRRPIEEQGDEAAQARLARRIAPFLLRRRKADVLTELPPKTEVLRTVTLGERQAALYESVRLAMDEKVRRAVAAQGLARSHVTILDALLKLRQICCDPRLLPLEAARGVRGSAKLELLMQMLPAMLEEGRRVLLFSQFTSMLRLIEAELHRQEIAFSTLTGETRDRDAAIERFRSGAVDLFLISLKAGGVGLNLTEADTVILYDPWWNPAVEAQAADRAHRIGQSQQVFVYQLVTEGTVEEKILALQERKRALADGLYTSQGGAGGSFEAADLELLLAPLG